MRTALLAALACACLSAVSGLSDLAATYRLRCVGHSKPDAWIDEDDGKWEAPQGWSADPACPAELTASSFRAMCAPHLQPTAWVEEDDGPWVAPTDQPLPTCVVLFVPHILDSHAEGRMELLSALLGAAESEREKPLVFFWSAAGAQPALEEALEIGGSYPKLALYSPRHEVGAQLQLAPTPANIKSFLLKAALSRLPVRPAAVDVHALTSPEPWDLGDAEPPSCADDGSYDDVALESDV